MTSHDLTKKNEVGSYARVINVAASKYYWMDNWMIKNI